MLALSGAVLIIGEPSRSLENPAFQLKMSLLILGMVTTFVLQRPLRHDAAYWELSSGRKVAARLIAVVSILLWVGIIFCGRWIAYMNVYE